MAVKKFLHFHLTYFIDLDYLELNFFIKMQNDFMWNFMYI